MTNQLHHTSYKSIIDNYTPAASTVPTEHWRTVAPYFRQLLTDTVNYLLSHPHLFKLDMRYLKLMAYFFAGHCSQVYCTASYPLEDEFVLNNDVIAWSTNNLTQVTRERRRRRQYLSFAQQARSLKGTKSDLAQQLIYPGTWELEYRPYTKQEISYLLRWHHTQTTEYRKATAFLIIALGLGAGMSRKHMVELEFKDFTTKAGLHLIDCFPYTPILNDYFFPELTEHLDKLKELSQDKGITPRWVFVPSSTEERGTRLSVLLCTMNKEPGCPDINIPRLRATWIANLMNSGVSFEVISRQAGITVQGIKDHYKANGAPDEDRHLQLVSHLTTQMLTS